MSGGNVPRIALWIISEFKLNDHLKIDGRKVDVLLLGLRNDFYLPIAIPIPPAAAAGAPSNRYERAGSGAFIPFFMVYILQANCFSGIQTESFR